MMSSRDLATAHARNLATVLDRARARAFARVIDRELVSDLITVLGSALAIARALDRPDDLVAALATARDLASGLAGDLDRARVLTLADDLDCDLDNARILALGLIRAIGGVHADTYSAGSAPIASRLLTVATRLLPPADRSRYLEELRAELNAIAAARGGRRAQLAYAMRQLGSACRLRAELRAPRRRGATQ